MAKRKARGTSKTRSTRRRAQGRAVPRARGATLRRAQGRSQQGGGKKKKTRKAAKSSRPGKPSRATTLRQAQGRAGQRRSAKKVARKVAQKAGRRASPASRRRVQTRKRTVVRAARPTPAALQRER